MILKYFLLILVTGASGFLGNYLLEELVQQPVTIRAIYNSHRPAFSHPNVEWVQCDLQDVYAVAEIMKNIKQVYHCAAIVSFDGSDKDKVLERNVSTTANVVNEALEAGVEKLIHVSSIAALGRANVGNLPIDEETHWQDSKNNTAYAIGKFQSEMEVWRAMAEGLNAAIVNPGIILGVGDWDKGSAKLMQNVAAEFPWYTEGVNGWVDAQDVARAMILLMNSDITEQRFILTQGNHSYQSVFTMMASALRKKPPYKKASRWMTEVIWRIAKIKSILSGKPSLITKETARTAQTKCFYNNNKFLKTFPGFAYTPIEQTIQNMAEGYQRSQK